jgi:alpha-L-arabinofuranosidase
MRKRTPLSAKSQTATTGKQGWSSFRSRRDFLRTSVLAAVGGAASVSLADSLVSWGGLASAQKQVGRIWIDVEEAVGEINRNIYGHMLESVGRALYDAVWVGEGSTIPNDKGIRKDAISSMQRVRAPVIRWPGGCFADTYHWRDGIGPREKRPKQWNLWWEQYETNAIGTDEFIYYCNQANAAPYFSINVGTGDVKEAVSWVEYCNSDKDTELTRMRKANGYPAPHGVRYWGVGNETWGCGGLYEPEDYAKEYLRYAMYLKHWLWPSKGISTVPVELIAAGHTAPDWNQKFLEKVRNWPPLVDHLSIHHYFRTYPNQPLATPPGGGPVSGDLQFTDKEYYLLVSRVDELKRYVQEAVDVIDYYFAGRKKIGLIVDEWGTWHPQATFETGFYQQNTLRDAIVAGSTFNYFNSRCRDITMANISQAFNVLQSIGLTKGPQMILTPTFHVMEMYQRHQGAQLVRSRVETPSYEMEEGGRKRLREAVNVSASLSGNRLLLTAVNEDLARDLEFDVRLRGAQARSISGRRLWSSNVREHNTFDNPERLTPTSIKIAAKGSEVRLQLPAHSVSAFDIELS